MTFLLSPVTLFWVLLALSFIFYKLKYKRTFRAFVIMAFAELFLFSVSPLSVWMLQKLEEQYPVYRSSANDKQLPILVLGGGHTNDPDLAPMQRLSPSALGRVTEGIRQYNLSPGSRLILSGHSQSGKTPNAEVMALTALSLGVNAKDTLMMMKPGTTWEEAQAFKKRFGTSGEFILVTSAVHMPRAVETFRRLGLKPIPAPTHYYIKHDPDTNQYSWKPSAIKLYYADIALHEYVGRLYYKWFKEE